MGKKWSVILLLLSLSSSPAAFSQQGTTQPATVAVTFATSSSIPVSIPTTPSISMATREIEIQEAMLDIGRSSNETSKAALRVAFVSFLVAFAALFVSWKTAKLGREQNERLSSQADNTQRTVAEEARRIKLQIAAAEIEETKKQNTFKLNEIYMSQVQDRKTANKRLKQWNKDFGPQTNRNYEERVLVKEDYHPVERVLHFFDNLQDLKEHGLIDEDLARGLFSRAYNNLFEYFETMARAEEKPMDDPNPTITQRVCKLRKWLVDERARVEVDVEHI